MKNIVYYGFVYILLFINNPGMSQFNPCYDDLYLKLKARGLNAMTTREYHYFTRKDEECSEYNTFDKQYHDQLNTMQNEIIRIADRLSELDEDIELENIYGLGRLKSTDPELRSLAIIQSKDDDLRNEFNTLLEKLIVVRNELKEEMNKDNGPEDLIVNSLTVVDSSEGGFIKTVSKDGKNTVMIGNHPSGSGSVITYNEDGAPSVRIGSSSDSKGYLNIRNRTGKNAVFIGEKESGNSLIISNNSNGRPVFIAGSDKNNNGYIKTKNVNGNSTIMSGSKNNGDGYIATFNEHGKRMSLISNDKNKNGIIGIYDKNETLQLIQKGVPPNASSVKQNINNIDKKD